jgi:hypothetical protein
MTTRGARGYSSLCEPVRWLSGILYVLISPDGSGNPFSFLLSSSTSGNKKEKDCNGQRDQKSLWNAKRVLQIFFNIIPYIYCMDFINGLYLQLINFKK